MISPILIFILTVHRKSVLHRDTEIRPESNRLLSRCSIEEVELRFHFDEFDASTKLPN